MIYTTRFAKKKKRKSKFNAVKTEYNGKTFDSKFEASVAQQLDLRVRSGQILGYDTQFKIECIPYDLHGNPLPKLKISHKVDFRLHNLDGTFTLLEAKGMESTDYRRRRKWLEQVWLPENIDYDYKVVYKEK